MTDIPIEALAEVAGGGAVGDWFRHAYTRAVNVPTAVLGGWKLAGQMYGSQVTMDDRVRSMRVLKGVLDASNKLPAWAPKLW
jgi:hypothetical protein